MYWDWSSAKREKTPGRRILLFSRWPAFLFRCGRSLAGPVGVFHPGHAGGGPPRKYCFDSASRPSGREVIARVVRPSGAYFVRTNFCEAAVSGNDLVVDGIGDLLRQALLILGRDVRWKLLRRQKKWIGVDNTLALRRDLFREEAHRHQFIFHPARSTSAV